ncbi:hypothetical protein LY76DRAFT_205202 [Colletotrichum caudatum]|nr:hypothetical protein LY76DRAFT_205202 [Colletotrichum caudatum]
MSASDRVLLVPSGRTHNVPIQFKKGVDGEVRASHPSLDAVEPAGFRSRAWREKAHSGREWYRSPCTGSMAWPCRCSFLLALHWIQGGGVGSWPGRGWDASCLVCIGKEEREGGGKGGTIPGIPPTRCRNCMYCGAHTPIPSGRQRKPVTARSGHSFCKQTLARQAGTLLTSRENDAPTEAQCIWSPQRPGQRGRERELTVALSYPLPPKNAA